MVDLDINGAVIKDIELVIFDRDGTLIDLYSYWSWMIGKRAELICERLNLEEGHRKKLMFVMGIDETDKKIRPGGPVGLKKREIVMQEAIDYLSLIKLNDTNHVCMEVFQEVDKISFGNLENIIKPIDGLQAIFNKLTRNSCKIAIATTDKTERARISMDFLGLTRQIDCIMGEDGVRHPKPAPDMANKILSYLNINKNNAVMVGDAITDAQMGISAGLRASIAVLTGLTSLDEFKKVTPYVIKNIGSIKIKNAEE